MPSAAASLVILSIGAILCAPSAAAQSVAHPLDPLSSDEILKTSEVLRAAGKVTDKSRLSLIALN